jgi:hypothetical protein
MMFMTRYRTKPHMSKADLKDMMDLFGSVGEAPGTISHYVDADGGGGWIIAESDDPASNYANTIRYQPYLQIETSVILTIDQAVAGILEALA